MIAANEDSDNGVWITKPDLSSPESGFFQIKLGKGCLSRALAVLKIGGCEWAVYMDGVLVAPQSPSWVHAFGDLFGEKRNCLVGKRINHEKYLHLLEQRQRDITMGIDLESPQDITNFPVP